MHEPNPSKPAFGRTLKEEPTEEEAFADAIEEGDLETVKNIMAGRDLELELNGKKETALHIATREGHTNVAKLLCEKGAKTNATNKFGWTPLHWAAENCLEDMTALLMKHKAKTYMKTSRAGDTPLHFAADKLQAQGVMKVLLDKGSNPNATNNTGSTPLHIACAKPIKENAELLVDAGAEVLLKDEYRGWTSLQFAADAGDIELVKLLTTKGMHVDAQDWDEATALHWAEYSGDDKVIKKLIEEKLIDEKFKQNREVVVQGSPKDNVSTLRTNVPVDVDALLSTRTKTMTRTRTMTEDTLESEHAHKEDPLKPIFDAVVFMQEKAVPLLTGVLVALVMANTIPALYKRFFTAECPHLRRRLASEAHHVYGDDHAAWDHHDDHAWTLLGFEDCLRYELIPCPILGHAWTIHFVANDIIMAIFFGLATKEVTEAILPGGSLNPPSKALNPLVTTIGGIFGPVGLYFIFLKLFLAFGWFDEELDSGVTQFELTRGWGVVTATDIVLAWLIGRIVFGDGHPAIDYLLLLAVVDDLMGIVIIAIFYPDPVHPTQPGQLYIVGIAMFLAFLMRKWHFRKLRKSNQPWQPYVIICGTISWIGFLRARLHPALSLVPIVPFMPGPQEHILALNNIEKLIKDELERMMQTQSQDAPGGNRRKSMIGADKTEIATELEASLRAKGGIPGADDGEKKTKFRRHSSAPMSAVDIKDELETSLRGGGHRTGGTVKIAGAGVGAGSGAGAGAGNGKSKSLTSVGNGQKPKKGPTFDATKPNGGSPSAASTASKPKGVRKTSRVSPPGGDTPLKGRDRPSVSMSTGRSGASPHHKNKNTVEAKELLTAQEKMDLQIKRRHSYSDVAEDEEEKKQMEGPVPTGLPPRRHSLSDAEEEIKPKPRRASIFGGQTSGRRPSIIMLPAVQLPKAGEMVAKLKTRMLPKSARARRLERKAELEEKHKQGIFEEEEEDEWHDHAESTLGEFEHFWKIYVDFGLGIFSLVNAGVEIKGVGAMTFLILGSLVIGKILGIIIMYHFAVLICRFPPPLGVKAKHVHMIGLMAALGLTVALFVSEVAFQDEKVKGDCKLGALLSALVLVPCWVIGNIINYKEDVDQVVAQQIHVEIEQSKIFGPRRNRSDDNVLHSKKTWTAQASRGRNRAITEHHGHDTAKRKKMLLGSFRANSQEETTIGKRPGSGLFSLNKKGASAPIPHHISQMFDALDSDGNGELDEGEFRQLAKKFGFDVDSTVQVMKRVDKDGNGVIDKQEFNAWLEGKIKHKPKVASPWGGQNKFA
jgi:ankyrin repeat protein/Na+/H+ antiporter NhaA